MVTMGNGNNKTPEALAEASSKIDYDTRGPCWLFNVPLSEPRNSKDGANRDRPQAAPVKGWGQQSYQLAAIVPLAQSLPWKKILRTEDAPLGEEN